ncbi:MAG TPA: hypothetical protein VIY73_17995, partial [Polyangiaceae bacterium]
MESFPSTSSEIRPLLDRQCVPWLMMTDDQVKSLRIDHRAGFVLSLVDGRCTVEMIFDVCGLEEEEAREILLDLADLGAIDFH